MTEADPRAGKRILVIEDDADTREVIVYRLTRAGHEVTHCPDGEEGLRRARLERPDLVVLDLMLPGMDGTEVCRALQKDAETRETAIVIVSARGGEGEVVYGFALGADDYLLKPFSSRELVARVEAVLRRRAAARPMPPRAGGGTAGLTES